MYRRGQLDWSEKSATYRYDEHAVTHALPFQVDSPKPRNVRAASLVVSGQACAERLRNVQ